MLRTFETHNIRKETELSGKVWEFTGLENEQKDTKLQVVVPSCWESYAGFESYRGKCLYETVFEAEGDVKIEFKGVSHGATVFVDDKEMISHYDAYTPFDIIVKALEKGEHSLKVIVDNSFKEDYSLNKSNDYMSYGGINRGVVLQNISKVYITNTYVTPIEKVGDLWKAKIEILVNNISDKDQEIQIISKVESNEFSTGKVIAKVGKSKVFEEIIEFKNLESWNVESPKLYKIISQLSINGIVCDDLVDRVGFRTVKIKGKQILINDRPVLIKGFNRHEDHPHFCSALPMSAMAYDLGLIKDMGGNSVRTSHYPNDEIFLDLCDEMGILVWEESHARSMKEEHMRRPLFQQHSLESIENMITNHYNHPSIYIWAILNECASETEFGRELYKGQLELIRKLDKSRPCSFATCKYNIDICLDLPDVICWNMYPYWYEEKTADQMIREIHDYTMENCQRKEIPFMITEIGAGAIYGFRSSDNDKWTEEYQCYALENQIKEVLAFEDCMGVYIWQFCDIRVSKEYFAHRPRTRNNKGIVDEYRKPKLAYDTVKKAFTSYGNYWE